MSFWKKNKKRKAYEPYKGHYIGYQKLPQHFDVKSCMESFATGWSSVGCGTTVPDTSQPKTQYRTEVEVRMANVLHTISHTLTKKIINLLPDRTDALMGKCIDTVLAVDDERWLVECFVGSEDFLRTRHLVNAAKFAKRTNGVVQGVDDLLELAILNARLKETHKGWGRMRWGEKIATEENLDDWVDGAKQLMPEARRALEVIDDLKKSTNAKILDLYELLKQRQQEEDKQSPPPPPPPPPGRPGGKGSNDDQQPGQQPGEGKPGEGEQPSDEEIYGDSESSLSWMDLEDGAKDRPNRKSYGGKNQGSCQPISKESYDKSRLYFSKAVELMLETQYANKMVRAEYQGMKIKSRQLPHVFTDGKIFARRDEAPGELLNVAVLLDRSDSIFSAFPNMAGMAKALLDVVEQYGGEARLWMFGTTTSSSMTSERMPLNSSWAIEGDTRPAQAIKESNEWLSKKKGRRICIIITDGAWNHHPTCTARIKDGKAAYVEHLLITFDEEHYNQLTNRSGLRDHMLKNMPSYVSVAAGRTVPEVAMAAIRALRVR